MFKILFLIIFTFFFEYILSQTNSKKDFVYKRKNIAIKRKKILKNNGCLLKNKKFCKINKCYFSKFRYIFCKKNHIFLTSTTLFYGKSYEKKLAFFFCLCVNDEKFFFDFTDFEKTENQLALNLNKENFLFNITINSDFCFNITIQNKTRKLQMLNFSLSFFGKLNKNNIIGAKGNIFFEKNENFFKIICKKNVKKRTSWQFALNICKLQTKNRFFAIKRYFPTCIFNVLERQVLTDYTKFKDVKQFANKHNLSLSNLFYLELFSSQDFRTLQALKNNIDILKCFSVKILCVYKRIFPFNFKMMQFVNYYSDKLHIFNYLKKYYSFSLEKNQLKQQTNEMLPIIVDFELNERLYLCSSDKIFVNFQNFDNYRIFDKSLMLESLNERNYYNFSCKIKLQNNIICQDNAVAIVESSKKQSINYLETIYRIENLKQKQTIFIDFWQNENDKNLLQQDINSKIQICQPVSLIYANQNNYKSMLMNLKSYKDCASKLIYDYNLLKFYDLGMDVIDLLVGNKDAIIRTLIECVNLSQKSQNEESLLILYIHCKNVKKNKFFKDYINLLTKMLEQLEQKLRNFLTKLKTAQTFNELISLLSPNYFNYEFLLDYLIKFEAGHFKFKEDICFYDSIFHIHYNDKKKLVELQGKSLNFICKNNLKFNNNLYLSLNFDEDQILKIIDYF